MKIASAFIGAALAVAVSSCGAAYAVNLVQNGDFESTTSGAGQLGYNTDATDWTSAAPNGSYNFLFTPGSADTSGVTGEYGNLQLWGPGNGSANGLPASSPDGGNYVGLDGAFQVGALAQTINGLTRGQTYAVSFDWAGAQQSEFFGANTEQLQVSLGSQTQSTAIYDNPSQGFSGWMTQTFYFTPGSSSEVLSFLAVGTPSGVPPFSLLDSVSLNAVPEPSTCAMMCLGFAGLGFAAYRRQAKFGARAIA
jgi:hypothetical protein